MEKYVEKLEQKDVTFYEDELVAVRAAEGQKLFESDHHER